tara:strand:- start:175 stop:1077 length:903 start_codon:yes stop_codon:yes gene_type:complete
MFTMMNESRLKVGVQGLAIAEAAYQQAQSFADEREQGGKIISKHADVHRMLMTMTTAVQAMRALSYNEAITLDLINNCDNSDERQRYQSRIDFMIPVIKGWSSELGTEVASLGIQVHGGMGYIEETGAAQYLRDVRITSIYEGTNGIQAGDLVGRKLFRDEGIVLMDLLADIEANIDVAKTSTKAETQAMAKYLATAVVEMQKSVKLMLVRLNDELELAMLSSFDFMMQTGYVLGAGHLLHSALLAEQAILLGSNDCFYIKKLGDADFYMRHLLPRATAHYLAIVRAENSTLDLVSADTS